MIDHTLISRQMTFRYITAVAIMAATVIISHLFVQHHLSINDSLGKVINVSGKQRMLSQRIALYTSFLEANPSSENSTLYTDQLRQAVTLMKDSHQYLTSEDTMNLIPNPAKAPIHTHYFEGTYNTDGLVREYIDRAENILNKRVAGDNIEISPADLEYIILMADSTLLEALDKAVRLYEGALSSSIQSFEKVQTLALAITLIILILVSMFIFKPMTTRMTHQLRSLTKSNEELEKFAYIASHDLKSPLRGISNLTSWLIDDDNIKCLNEDNRERLDMIKRRVGRMEVMLNDILEYSRIGKSKLVLDKVDTNEIILQIIDDMGVQDKYNIKITGNLPVLTSPKTPIEQVFTNLINNSIKHHHKPTGKIEIKSRSLDPKYYEFSVSDDGPGIDKKYHDRVFEMFQTLKSRDQVEGTGLGMAIIKKIIEQAGGEIWISEKSGSSGTCVKFTWPMVYKDDVSY
ncbi:MAG: hypothetical protein CL565_01115 [Alphaproteobacteria bacterium]|nr:hypothetical protein [Alphaproteobacteria bacterium]|tara:strand:- start:822 stop:2201 length:1380 start_codon:yes stop_codon:yes gene_type:complete